MPNATNLLQATISSTDNNNLVPINRSLSNPSFAGTFAELASFLNCPTSGVDTVLNLPATPVLQLYIKNLNVAGGGNLTVKLTPNGGAQATVIILAPQSVLLIWEVIAGAGLGVTGVSLNPAANNTPAEVFFGG